MVFLAADKTRLEELKQAVRQYLAWKGICDEQTTLNLDPFQSKQADSKCKNADSTVEGRIPETYHWLLVPSQPDPKGAVEWIDIRLQGQDALAVRASKKMKNDMLLVPQMGGSMLKLQLDKIPLWRGDHVSLKQLAEDFAKYLYLPRLKDTDVLLAAVRDGIGRLTWQTDAFAYAERYDEVQKRYVGMQAGQAMQVLVDSQSVLIRPEVAAAQLEAERLTREAAAAAAAGNTGLLTGDLGASPAIQHAVSGTVGTGTPGTQPVAAKKPRRFHGAAELDTLRVGRDAARIAEEIIQHLSTVLGTSVRITMEIEADIPQGASDELVRTVTENCRTLKFKSHGFEES